jgi:hypothetical protein
VARNRVVSAGFYRQRFGIPACFPELLPPSHAQPSASNFTSLSALFHGPLPLRRHQFLHPDTLPRPLHLLSQSLGLHQSPSRPFLDHRHHWCSAFTAARQSAFEHFPSLHASSYTSTSVSPPSCPVLRARLSPPRPTQSAISTSEPDKPTHSARPSHYTSTFSFENPQGVDNCDTSIENIEFPDN